MADEKDVNMDNVSHVEHGIVDFERKLNDVAPKLDKMWWHYPHLLKLNILLWGAIMVQATGGYGGSMLNGLQSLNAWEDYFNHPQGAGLGTLSSGTTFGGLFALYPASVMCDRFGRRWPMIIGSLFTVIGAIIQGVAQNFGTFWVGRFIIGMGLTLLGIGAPMLLAETSYPTQRSVLTSLYETSYPLGAMIGALVTFGSYYIQSTWAWRLPSLLQVEEARAVLVKYHGGGDENSELVRYELAEIKAALQSDKIKKSGKWKQWLMTNGNRHRLGIIMFIPVITQLSGNQVISFYLHLILDSVNITASRDQLVINSTLLVLELVFAVIVASQAEFLGRRRFFMVGIIGMIICFIPWTILSALAQEGGFSNPGLSKGVIAMIYLYMIQYHIVAPLANVLLTEVAPYELRSKASAIFSLMGSIIGLFQSYVNPIAMAAISWKYYIVFLCILCCEFIVVYFYFPETKGLSLEEVSVIFEEDAAAVGTGALRHGDIEDPTVENLSMKDVKST
ncbi:major facilitator superfamily domain-containing protein [Umbelopsis sp. PMI_123]|nr:major facilitator superfamily domain-containing protein [Umbelopsis sp. PMI_123]